MKIRDNNVYVKTLGNAFSLKLLFFGRLNVSEWQLKYAELPVCFNKGINIYACNTYYVYVFLKRIIHLYNTHCFLERFYTRILKFI